MRRIIDFFIIPLLIILVLVVAVICVQRSSFANKTSKDYIRDLSSSDVQRRWFAAYSLGKLGDTESAGPLLNALKDDSKEVRWHAAIALGNIKDKRSVPDLIKRLKLKPSPLFAKILNEVEERQVLGKITSRAEALDLARKLADKA